MTDPNRTMLFARAIAEELIRAGVRTVAVAPGSRSGPLALALAEVAEREGASLSVHLDERSAGFFALGAAISSCAPAAVLCTSGTAAANLLPAAVEAFRARVPLVLVTADRPPELRGCGASQTVDQLRIFGSHVRAAAELPVPEPMGVVLRAARAATSRIVLASTWPVPGPVHLNVPLREPLDPRVVPGDVPPVLEDDALALSGRGAGVPFVRMPKPCPVDVTGAAERLAVMVAESPRGLIVAGPTHLPPEHGARLRAAVAALSRASGYAVLADPCSSLRGGGPEGAAVLARYDAFLRSEKLAAALAPDLVIRFGAPPVSKALMRYIDRHPRAAHVLVDPGDGVEDPLHLGPEVVRAEPAALAAATAGMIGSGNRDRLRGEFTQALAEAESRAGTALERAADAELFEAGLVRALSAALPGDALLFAGNSMPIRELDSFLPVRGRALRVLANRGASGIDGVVSSALGAVAASGRPGVLLVGDVSLLHDATSLLTASRLRIPLTIVAINNDGGGIFSYLPVREMADEPASAARFEALFATPHGLELGPLADLFGLPHARAVDEGGAAAAVSEAISSGGPSLIEVRFDRERSASLHRKAWEAAVEAVDAP